MCVPMHVYLCTPCSLNHAKAPSTIDYLSLDIEGAELDALKAFDFAKYRFLVLTIERPVAALRALLRQNGYSFLKTGGCFGDQMWVHGSIFDQSVQALGIEAPVHSNDFNECCLPSEEGYVKGSTIDNGCCASVGDQKECVSKLSGGGR